MSKTTPSPEDLPLYVVSLGHFSVLRGPQVDVGDVLLVTKASASHEFSVMSFLSRCVSPISE